ncbi:DUF429 domain-containing protein [Methylobrevis albus]|uniref:DUF429 domain-containing protein n=1 Tax=Methylobrevis albus TaxID=2793297 RepID=A0A931I2F6_9HYPH|nr:DUF429 domain-containing protein [Methylobrevis albus]MBH0238055.1 DUF429 domain-containing protein [Methylobrevis albus]
MSGAANAAAPVVAGVDGCPGGWIAVFRRADGSGTPSVRVVKTFRDVLDGPEQPAVVAVDMPIGLPERIGPGGRGPERLVRPLLGPRQSSVFSVPARSAVEAPDYAAACAAALATSEPPRKVSKQAFHLFPKIREIDALLVADAGLRDRVFEVHPEVAFWRLAGGRPMATPKKVKGAVNPEGIAERRALLARHGFDPAFLAARPPRGAALDDYVDACVCAVIAGRILAGTAEAFPAEDLRDARGLRIAIHA